MDAKYIYVGPPGEFVPGLPAEITATEALLMGVWELLQDAIDSGLYKVEEGE